MSSFRLTKQAKDDLKSIARYTQEIWGRDQRNKYLGILDNCFHLLADKPGLGETYDKSEKVAVSSVLNGGNLGRGMLEYRLRLFASKACTPDGVGSLYTVLLQMPDFRTHSG